MTLLRERGQFAAQKAAERQEQYTSPAHQVIPNRQINRNTDSGRRYPDMMHFGKGGYQKADGNETGEGEEERRHDRAHKPFSDADPQQMLVNRNHQAERVTQVEQYPGKRRAGGAISLHQEIEAAKIRQDDEQIDPKVPLGPAMGNRDIEGIADGGERRVAALAAGIDRVGMTRRQETQ